MIVAGSTTRRDFTFTVNTDGVFIAPPFLHSINFQSPAGMQTIRLGTTPGGDEIMIDTEIGAMNEATFHQPFLPGTPIYITGVVAALTLKIRL